MADIRIADASLGLKKKKKARLQYFQHVDRFRSRPTEPYAKLRLACLELPFYEGNNVRHARELLQEYKTSEDKLNTEAIEMAWTCELASYAKTDRNKELVDRVRKFYKKYPNSALLKSLIEPVREVQSTRIDQLIKDKKYSSVISLYEKTKSTLYPTLNRFRRSGLFESYVMLYKSYKAGPFIRAYSENISNPFEKLVFLVGVAENQTDENIMAVNEKYSEIIDNANTDPLSLEKNPTNRLL